MNSTRTSAESQSEPDREMLIELVQLHAQALLRMPWVQTCLVLALALLIHAYINALYFVGWAALTIGVETCVPAMPGRCSSAATTAIRNAYMPRSSPWRRWPAPPSP